MTVASNPLDRFINTLIGLLVAAAIVIFSDWDWLALAPIAILIFNAAQKRVSRIIFENDSITIVRVKSFSTSKDTYPLSKISVKKGIVNMSLAKQQKGYLKIPPLTRRSNIYISISAGGKGEIATIMFNEEGWTPECVAKLVQAFSERGIEVKDAGYC